MMVFSAQLSKGEVAAPFPILFQYINPLHPLPARLARYSYLYSPLLSGLSYLHSYWAITVSLSYISNHCTHSCPILSQPCSILSYFVQYWAVYAISELTYPILSSQHPCLTLAISSHTQPFRLNIELFQLFNFELFPPVLSRVQLWAISSCTEPPLLQHWSFWSYIERPELVFLNLYGAQESMPRHQLRQPI